MPRTLSARENAQLVKSISIPPCPAIVMALMQERAKPEPDVRRLVKLVSRDVGLSAAIIKTVNSPFFGLARKIAGVPQAINLLGLDNSANVITSLVLRHMAGSNAKAAALQCFWEHSARTAAVCAFLGRRLDGVPQEEAYSYGLFHHAGMPVLADRFADYRATLAAAAQAGEDMIAREEAAHETNHAIIGHLLARTWFLPEVIQQAILCHHDDSAFDPATLDAPVRGLIAAGHLAHRLLAGVGLGAPETEGEWRRHGAAVLRQLDLGDDDLPGLETEVGELFHADARQD